MRQLFAVAGPARLTQLVVPLLVALRNRAIALVEALLRPFKKGVQDLLAVLEAIDLTPLREAVDGVYQEVRGQVAALSPEQLLGDVLAAFTALASYVVMLAPVGALSFLFGGVDSLEVLIGFIYLFVLALIAVSLGLALPSIWVALLLSLLFAGLMLYRRGDIKRLFAYSSIEHMGIITFAFGMGGPLANFAGLLHMTMHSLTKSAIFFAVGHVVQARGTQDIGKIRGLTASHPALGWGLVVGVAASYVALSSIRSTWWRLKFQVPSARVMPRG
jgi:hypothetical protein